MNQFTKRLKVAESKLQIIFESVLRIGFDHEIRFKVAENTNMFLYEN